jgi:lysophospholipase L1-like esterase
MARLGSLAAYRAQQRARAVGAGLVGAFPKVSLIAYLGDSITNQHGVYTDDTQVKVFSLRGRLHALMSDPELSRAMYVDGRLNFGISGETSTQILARTPAAIATARAMGAQAFDLMAGTNDVGTDIETVWSNLTQICQLILDAGFGLNFWSILQRSNARWQDAVTAGTITQAAVDAEKTKNEAIRLRQIIYAAGKPRVRHIDPVPAMNDPAYDRCARAEYFVDGLHPNILGGFVMAGVAKPVYRPLLAPPTLDLAATTDILLTNPHLTGTGGVVGLDVQAGSSIPTGWSAQRTRGQTKDSGTLTIYEEASDDGVSDSWRVMDFQNYLRAAADGNENWAIQQQILLSSGKYVPGDVLELTAEARLWSHNGNLIGISANISETDGTLQRVNWSSQGTIGQYWPTDTRRLLLTAPRCIVRPNSGAGTPAATIQLVVQGDVRTAFTGKIGFRRVRVRKIA